MARIPLPCTGQPFKHLPGSQCSVWSPESNTGRAPVSTHRSRVWEPEADDYMGFSAVRAAPVLLSKDQIKQTYSLTENTSRTPSHGVQSKVLTVKGCWPAEGAGRLAGQDAAPAPPPPCVPDTPSSLNLEHTSHLPALTLPDLRAAPQEPPTSAPLLRQHVLQFTSCFLAHFVFLSQ